MAVLKQKITPCLWFDTRAEEAANFYTAIFDNSRINQISRYGNAGREVHGKEAGSVMLVEFELEGQTFTALNGGPQFKFDEAISFQVMCDSQDEIDYFWRALTAGGQEGQCGWLKDRFGLSWQVVPSALPQMLTAAAGALPSHSFAGAYKLKRWTRLVPGCRISERLTRRRTMRLRPAFSPARRAMPAPNAASTRAPGTWSRRSAPGRAGSVASRIFCMPTRCRPRRASPSWCWPRRCCGCPTPPPPTG